MIGVIFVLFVCAVVLIYFGVVHDEYVGVAIIGAILLGICAIIFFGGVDYVPS